MINFRIIYFLLFIAVSCGCKNKPVSFPNDLSNRIIGDWVVENKADHNFILRDFDASVDDSCTVYRFKGPDYFTTFFYLKSGEVSSCGNSLRSNDILSNWTIDSLRGFMVIDNVQSAVGVYLRTKIKYDVLEDKPNLFSFKVRKILTEEEKSTWQR